MGRSRWSRHPIPNVKKIKVNNLKVNSNNLFLGSDFYLPILEYQIREVVNGHYKPLYVLIFDVEIVGRESKYWHMELDGQDCVFSNKD